MNEQKKTEAFLTCTWIQNLETVLKRKAVVVEAAKAVTEADEIETVETETPVLIVETEAKEEAEKQKDVVEKKEETAKVQFLKTAAEKTDFQDLNAELTKKLATLLYTRKNDFNLNKQKKKIRKIFTSSFS